MATNKRTAESECRDLVPVQVRGRAKRRHVLDSDKKEAVVALLSVGCSQRLSARYAGCPESTLRRVIARDPAFAAKVRKAKCNAEVGLLRNIRGAAKKEQYWRAAAWMLERTFPDRYARRGPDVITVEQIGYLLTQFAQILAEEVPVAKYRKPVLRRLQDLCRGLSNSRPGPARDRKRRKEKR
jgi:hypothetical protein